ncbi:hypothetical protein B2J69_17295 [Pantoea latae]|uniref:Uncharacterized protein n=1 Tax=Pantoea latae TaxID=1964541 RepID=A0A1V9DD26_9GAMM|nr:hypothetical protein B2J69_17295 [Pantoea latae]
MPLSTGVALLVRPPAVIAVPPSVLLSSRSAATTGGVVSTVKATASEAGPALPAASVTTAVRLWSPSLSAGVVKLQLPSVPTAAEPSAVSPS